jgi:hypothetical protein
VEEVRRGPARGLAAALIVVAAIGVGYRAFGPEDPGALGSDERSAGTEADGDATARPLTDGSDPFAGFEPTPPPFPGLSGLLVFPSTEPGAGPVARQRLWAFDLGSGRLFAGPAVPDVQELLPAGSGPGWLVFTTVRAGSGAAYVVRRFSPDVEAEQLASGDLFALTPDGTTLYVGRSAAVTGGEADCPSHVIEIDRVDVAGGLRRSLWTEFVSCGELVSLGTDGDRVWLTLLEAGAPTVHRLTPRGPRPVLPGYALLSVSPVGGMLVTPADDGRVRGLGVWPGTPTGPARYWSGRGRPTRFLPRGTELYAERVVAWSRMGTQAVVTGIVGDRRGMWRVEVTFGDRESSTRLGPNGVAGGQRHPPQPALPSGELPPNLGFSGAAFSVDLGPVFTSRTGELLVVVPGGQGVLPLAPGGPRPAGPLTWLP